MNNIQILLSHRKAEPEDSVLYLVGTPIGNLDDISIRAINILKKVSLIACEDTRTTGNLLNHLDIKNKLISFHKYNSSKRLDYMISKLKEGKSIALVTDAGMPLISDPGEILVKQVKRNNFDVICIPGPCAALTALVSSGLTSSKFTFYGFIPKINKERSSLLELISESNLTSIIYESPKKILRLLHDLKKVCGGDRSLVILKEMTKRYEQQIGDNIDEVISHFEKIEPKGEFTLILGGSKFDSEINTTKSLKNDLINLMQAGLSHSSAANYLSKKSGKSKNEIYKLILGNDL